MGTNQLIKSMMQGKSESALTAALMNANEVAASKEKEGKKEKKDKKKKK